MLIKEEKQSFRLTSKQEYTAYRELSGIPFNKRIRGRDTYVEFVQDFFKIVSEHLLNNVGGVYIKDLGYFFIWRIPRKMRFLSFTKDSCVSRYNFHTDHGVYLPVFIAEKANFYWSMDKRFDRNIKRGLRDRLRKGIKYKMFVSSLKRFKKL